MRCAWRSRGGSPVGCPDRLSFIGDLVGLSDVLRYGTSGVRVAGSKRRYSQGVCRQRLWCLWSASDRRLGWPRLAAVDIMTLMQGKRGSLLARGLHSSRGRVFRLFRRAKPAVSSILAGCSTVSLVMHLLLGCCWHHDHAEPATCPASSQTVCHTLGASCHGGAHEAGCTRLDHSPRPGCGERCAFVLPEASRTLVVTACSPALLVSPLEPRVAVARPALAAESAALRPAGSVRLHLLLQVLQT